MESFKKFLIEDIADGDGPDGAEVTYDDIIDLLDCVSDEDYVIIADAILDILDEIDPIADEEYLALCSNDFEMYEDSDNEDIDDEDIDESGSGRFTNVHKGKRKFSKRKVQLKRDRISKKAELRKKRLKYRVEKRKGLSKKRLYRKTYNQKVKSGKHQKKFHR